LNKAYDNCCRLVKDIV